MGFKRWDIIKIPFPAAGAEPEFRPALVIVAGELFRQHGLLWSLMITSVKNRGWPGDIPVDDVIAAGLGVPSVIRTAKIMTIEGHRAELIGTLVGETRREVGAKVFAHMGLTA